MCCCRILCLRHMCRLLECTVHMMCQCRQCACYFIDCLRVSHQDVSHCSLFICYHTRYGTKIPPSVLSDRLAAYVHYFTLHGALRPFGATALVASYDDETKEHALHMIEPSGMSHRYFACAAGKGRQPAKTEMEKLTLNNRDDPAQNISVREGVKQLARIVHALHDEAKDKPFELEMSWLCEESGWKHKGVPRDVIKESVEWAKKDIEEAEEEDEDSDEEMEG